MAVIGWQQSLFGADDPAPDGTFSTLSRVPLAGGAWLDVAPGWLSGHDTLMAALVEGAPWRQRSRHMYDGIVDEPRLTAWWGAKEADLDLPEVVHECRRVLSRRYGVGLDSVGCNLYRDGRDGVAWHGDTVRRTQAESIVAILSLGEPRRLLLRPRGGGSPSLRYELGSGDLFVMGGTCQHTWEHCVPKARRAGPRMSVTFRHSLPRAAA